MTCMRLHAAKALHIDETLAGVTQALDRLKVLDRNPAITVNEEHQAHHRL